MSADASKNVTRTQTMTSEKRGGYGSSSKSVTKLAPPPKGAAPGAPKSTKSPDKSK